MKLKPSQGTRPGGSAITNCGPGRSARRLSEITCSRSAFTLLEVMIALGIFFMAMFAILSLVSNTLRNARALQETTVDAGSLAAELMLTNKLYEGSYNGDFGKVYPDCSWDRDDMLITNGLWQCDFVVHQRTAHRQVETKMSIFVFSPDSQATPGGGFRR